ncbi:CheW protein [Desulfobulbus propionicus DSM 2032]|uniref:CheW protein n=1 Tax=Desulfobulbus propionicus (strain ATCC 33891 / DSM 2032 / VKM B-1956 / 1pr3) TaxID=577650 RepID=A0A7U3YKE7_DESPD|nr:chemotaxis protein CheW [Desulfobulbus propionicus]ADW17009.1 CheW protein [Desulfobulbus propionicus DSM 2032]
MSQEQLFASFLLDRQADLEIALPAEQVVEAMPLAAPIQPLPTGAFFLEGIMPLRGDVIPVINLKKRLALTETAYGDDAKVAVIQFNRKRYGLLVDDIREVLRVSPHAVQPLDPFLLTEETVIVDLIKLDQGRRTLELLDLRRLFPTGGSGVDEALDHDEPPPAVQRSYSQFVVFSCRQQIYGIPVGDSREICFFSDIDQTFKSGKVEGALQLRGQTIPVLCSATLLGCAEETITPTEETRILVMQSGLLSFGLIVDKIHQILVVADDAIMAIPGRHLPHLRGVCTCAPYNDIMLLDVQGLIGSQADRISAMTRLRKNNGSTEAEEESAARHLITEHCYLVFAIGKHYAIELKDVQEIIGCGDCMPIAGDGLVQGIINLRGRIVPVIRLRNFYACPDHNVVSRDPSPEDKLIIGRANGNLVALLVDEIITIYKQERYHATPSLRPELQAKKDTLDRLIEFINGEGLKEHVLVVNVANLLRHHLLIADQETVTPVAAPADLIDSPPIK